MGVAATIAAVALGGMAATSAYQAYSAATAEKPKAPTVAPPPQASKAPNAGSVLAGQSGTGQSGGAPGVAQTMLTGAGGVDPNLLQLGKSTLLGG